ncbi:MAG: c-type cytochrome [Gammaproteobacteria bacterium]|nr:c-type cytochrome [Gammaproteobacteria bacterium]MCP4090725.1 c-type cytochrome [Gammaproteobacteria bacterium]MCP4277152.1 c-type cytochrome [Gammaproteobacteria bacterium]MCP4832708.1 c-type cytochrome [Gammaproteobacteria bacterium]MCP4928038.1 c-type cytochrome [Gammaproteobacteria bacterium]
MRQLGVLRWLTILLMLLAGNVIAAGDPERGRALASACAACHGADGKSPSPAFPILAGQHEEYLYTSLKAYQQRGRDNAIMSATIVGKSDRQLKDLAAWFASQRGLGGGSANTNASGVAAAVTASGALLAEGGSDVATVMTGLPDELRCPDDSSGKYPDLDSDTDGLSDQYDAAPNDPNEFVLDTNNDGRYEICSIQQLQAILTLGDGAGNATELSTDARIRRDYELVRNIDASGIENFQPIGDCGPTGNCMNDLDKYGFKGSFDGRGHTISNLNINSPDVGGVGLFGVISSGKVVRNIELRNATVNGRAGTGTIVGSNFGTVYNCHSTGSVSGRFAIGGLVGANAGNVSFSHASVNVQGEMAVGGLVGDQNANIFSSYATGMVSGGRGVGGLVGLNTRGRIISSYATGDVSGGKEVGGLVGLNTDALLANSFSTGSVTGSDVNAGGLVGFNSKSRIRNAYATGNVRGNAGVGGISGNNNGVVFHSYATGTIEGNEDVGGLVGKNAAGTIAASTWGTDTTGQRRASGTEEGDTSGAMSMDSEGISLLNGEVSGWSPDILPVANPEYYFCDTDGSGEIEVAEKTAANYAWDMGNSSQFPVLTCVPGGVARQRN